MKSDIWHTLPDILTIEFEEGKNAGDIFLEYLSCVVENPNVFLRTEKDWKMRTSLEVS